MNDNKGVDDTFVTRVVFDSHLSEYRAYPASIFRFPQTSKNALSINTFIR